MSHFDLKCSLNIHDSCSELLSLSANYVLVRMYSRFICKWKFVADLAAVWL